MNYDSLMYNTKLTTDEENKYQDWLRLMSVMNGRNLNTDLNNYDMRGFWKSGNTQAANGHFTDQYKKPNHPTFSKDSIYSTPEMQGGEWAENEKGKWSFTPTIGNLLFHSPEELQKYFFMNEPDAILNNVRG